MRITREHAAGLVIDIQERLLPVMHNKENLMKNCSLVIRGLQTLDIPVLVTQQYSKGLGPTVSEISELFPDFSHIEKRDFSCCDEAEVISKLQSINRRFIIICGIESHVCVLQTAIDLKALGFTPVVVMDATSSRSAESLELAKERFRHEGIMMTSAESVLFELTRSSGAPEFKIISNLVR
jgi:nicotinamidase-related amidase